jgi:hypothetical protein
MNDELIERMAREADGSIEVRVNDRMRHFVSLVAEECAKVCDPRSNHQEILRIVLNDRAAAIRAMFPKKG